jgi:hypothetical protein
MSAYEYMGNTYNHWGPRSDDGGRVTDRFEVPDNSEASYKAIYYYEASEVLSDSETVVCSKG